MFAMILILSGCIDTYKLDCVEIYELDRNFNTRGITVLVNDKPVKIRTGSTNPIDALSVGQLVDIIYDSDFRLININIAQNCELDVDINE